MIIQKVQHFTRNFNGISPTLSLDENGMPVWEGVILNPDAPINQQRYDLKTINDGAGTPIPSIGLMVEI